MNLNIPINSVSFGQVSYNILKELKNRAGDPPSLFPIGNIDISSFSPDKEMHEYIQLCLNQAGSNYSRKNPSFKLWHINQLFDSVSRSANSMTFHETNALTTQEINILKEQDKIFVTSNYTKSVFEAHGLSNVVYCPLGFDSTHFKKIDLSEKKDEGVIVFGLRGKLEKRKHTLKILSAWVKAFGADPRYRLDCSIFNPHIDPQIQQQMIYSAVPHGEMPYNVNMLPSVQENSKYNMCLNAADIDLTGMSGCEGFNLPLFQSLCLGKHAVVLNAHVHKDFCNEKNSILVEPKGTLEANDDIFFKKGSPFNQGTWFDFEEDDLIDAMKKSVERFESNNNNKEGEKLKDSFTYKRTLDIILENI